MKKICRAPFGLVLLSHSEWSAQSYWQRVRLNGDIEPHNNNKIYRANSVGGQAADKPLFVTLSDQKELYYLTPSGIGWAFGQPQSLLMRSPDPKGVEVGGIALPLALIFEKFGSPERTP